MVGSNSSRRDQNLLRRQFRYIATGVEPRNILAEFWRTPDVAVGLAFVGVQHRCHILDNATSSPVEIESQDVSATLYLALVP